MPRIINYLDSVRPVRSYDEAELARLQLSEADEMTDADEFANRVAGLFRNTI